MQNLLFNSSPVDLYHFERFLQTQGYTIIAGIDEAGRGPLAGPVVAAAVVLNPEYRIDGVNDSKKLSEKIRESLFNQITNHATAIGIGLVDAGIIDEINILQATRTAMLDAVHALPVTPDRILIDGITPISTSIPQQTIKQGDSRSASIAAASIIAKVTRDRLMLQYDKLYPDYGFARHKGYGSAAHRAALQKHGPCPIHRMTFGGVKPLKKHLNP